jgi:hypothetical protein
MPKTLEDVADLGSYICALDLSIINIFLNMKFDKKEKLCRGVERQKIISDSSLGA